MVVVATSCSGRQRWGAAPPTPCAYYYGSNPLRIAWKLVEGDLTRKLDGEYEFQPVSGDNTQTEVIYHLEVDLVVPIPGFVKRRAESRIIRTALEDLRQRVEASVAS